MVNTLTFIRIDRLIHIAILGLTSQHIYSLLLHIVCPIQLYTYTTGLTKFVRRMHGCGQQEQKITTDICSLRSCSYTVNVI